MSKYLIEYVAIWKKKKKKVCHLTGLKPADFDENTFGIYHSNDVAEIIFKWIFEKTIHEKMLRCDFIERKCYYWQVSNLHSARETDFDSGDNSTKTDEDQCPRDCLWFNIQGMF
jgi:hypothetical protein